MVLHVAVVVLVLIFVGVICRCSDFLFGLFSLLLLSLLFFIGVDDDIYTW